MVREVPNYAQQYLAEHPGKSEEHSLTAPPPQPSVILSGVAPARSARAAQSKDPDDASGRNGVSGNSHHRPERNREAAGTDHTPPLTTRKSQRWNEIKKLEASVEHAMRGDWRALRTVFNAVGLTPGTPPSAQAVNRPHARKNQCPSATEISPKP
jgi:hypothetical protein